MGPLTLSSRARKGVERRRYVREDDVGALTLSSRVRKGAERRLGRPRGRRGSADVVFACPERGGTAPVPVREDDVGALTPSSRNPEGPE